MDKLDICLISINFAIMIIFTVAWGIARMIAQNFTESIQQSIVDLIIVTILWGIVAVNVSSRSVLYLSGAMIIIAGIVFDVSIKDHFGIRTRFRSLKLSASSIAYIAVLVIMLSTYHMGWWGSTELRIVGLFC